MIDLLKIIAIIIAIPAFIIALIGILFNWWVEGLIIETLLDALSISPFITFFITIIGFVILLISIITLIKSAF